jgi:Dolichyl-phosphate-mannose-protein mannosyltransferase
MKLPGKAIFRSSLFLLIIPLVLSAFTHLWNPIGFPSVAGNGNIDETEYMQRAMIVLDGGGLRDRSFTYDHPYFGQLFLAGLFRTIDYPDFFISSAAGGDIDSIQMLYLVPRVLMGILSIIDTFLVYKIAERRYNRNVALIASVLFAVMPMTWLLRRILLDSILMPFLLSSILFAVYYHSNTKKDCIQKKGKNHPTIENDNNKHKVLRVFVSGTFLGLAIFTKIPVITMIPLVGFLVVSASRTGKIKTLGLWIIPVILIPIIWPIHAWSIGEYNLWLQGIYYQTHRGGLPLYDSIIFLLKTDPLLLALSGAGIAFAIVKRDSLILLWSVPFLIFLYFIGFVQYFHIIPLLPVFCIGSARMIEDLINKVYRKQRKIIEYFSKENTHHYTRLIDMLRLSRQNLMVIIISAIGGFGLISTAILITTNLNFSYFESIAFVAKYLSHYNSNYNTNKLTLVSDVPYLWIQHYILHKNFYYKLYWDTEPVRTESVVLISDDAFLGWPPPKCCLADEIQMNTILNRTFPIAVFNENTAFYNPNKYPYTSISENWTPSKIEIRSNILFLNKSPFVIQVSKGPTVSEANNTLKVIIPANQSGLPLYWNDSSGNCDISFRCAGNFTTGWKDNTSFQVSTTSTLTGRWSSIYGNEIHVNPGEQYAFVTHMKLNEFARGSHIAIDGYNATSNKWNQLKPQCPAGTNGPLDWHEYRCDITIPASTSKIRPILNAGWSSEKGKEAVTLFDTIDVNKVPDVNKSYTNTTTISRNLVLNPDFIHFDNSARLSSLCKLRGDFDVQLHYRLVKWPPSNGVRVGLIAQESNTDDKLIHNHLKGVERISFGSKMDFPGKPREVYAAHFNGGVYIINATRQINLTNDMPINSMIDMSGKLRIVRSGLNTTGYYYSHGRWVPIRSEQDINPTDVNIVLQAGTRDFGVAHEQVEIAFVNYVNRGILIDCQGR